MKMNLRDFSVQLCVLKKTNGSFRRHQVCGTQSFYSTALALPNVFFVGEKE